MDEWVRAVSEPDPKLRKQAAEKLGNVGAADPAVVPALCIMLHDKDAEVRCQAILAFAKSGSSAGEAVEFLKAISRQDRDPKVRSYATKALAKLDK